MSRSCSRSATRSSPCWPSGHADILREQILAEGEAGWAVSVKGVVTAQQHVLLLLNERDEWELPGGRLEAGESPQQGVTREIREETGLAVAVEGIVDSWVYRVLPDREVLIVTYRCADLGRIPTLAVSDEHREARWVPIDACDDYPMPAGYLHSIRASR